MLIGAIIQLEMPKTSQVHKTIQGTILCIETSGFHGSVALKIGDKVDDFELPTDFGSAKSIAPAIASLLSRNSVRSSDLDLIAVVQGPGSFTGLRVGLALSRAMAFANDTPMIGISSLELIAQTFSDFARSTNPSKWFDPNQSDVIIATAINAFRSEAFFGLFQFSMASQVVRRTAVDQRVLVTEIGSHFPAKAIGKQVFLVGPEPKTFFPNELWGSDISHCTVRPSARSMLPIIGRTLESEVQNAPDNLLPIYLRGSAAEEKIRAT